jgi:hypothetical protein
VLEHPRFKAGEIDTGFLDDEVAALVGPRDEKLPAFVLDALAVFASESDQGSDAPGARHTQPAEATAGVDPWERLGTWRR